MQILISILIFALFSMAAFSEQGTMTTDDTQEAQSEASMSGAQKIQEVDAQAMEEVRIEDDEYDPNADPNTEIDEERMEEYQQEVQY